MKNLLFFLLLFLLPLAALAQSESCPRIWRSGDTLYTDPAAQIQWYRNDAPIPGATRSWHLPADREPTAYRVEVRGGFSPRFTWSAPEVAHVLFGHVVDELHRPLAGVGVRQGSRLTTTDAQGRFRLETRRRTDQPDVPVRVQLERTGYWRSTLRQHLHADTATAVRYQLRSQLPTNTVDANRGGQLLFPQFTLALPPRGFETVDGRPYGGTVLVYVDGRSPQDPDFGLSVPGGDLAVAGRNQLIDAVGFAAVELKTPDGRELRLRPGTLARLSFPITPQTAGADSVELWHYDQVSGNYQSDGWCYRKGNSLEGSVRNFSAWAAGARRERALLTGQLVDCAGRPAAWALLHLNQRTIVADGGGRFRAWVPAETDVVVRVEGREVARVNLAPNERRTLTGLLQARRWDGLGLYDEATRVLDVFVAGDVPPGLRFSLDRGQSWFSERQRSNVAPAPDSVWADDGCPHRLRVVVLARRLDCRVLTLNQLDSLAHNHPDQVARSVPDLRNASQPVYAANFRDQPGPIPFDLLAAQPCLQDLNLDNTGGTGLPARIGDLTQLVRLELARRNIGTLPESIGQLTRLQWLNLSRSQLQELPASIGQLIDLVELHLGENQIRELPPSIGELTLLKTIYLNDNRLESLPNSVGGLASLDSLDLRNNLLQALPASIGELRNLRHLTLESNDPLTALPESIGRLRSLKFLSVRRCRQLTSLPDSIGELTQLDHLDLSGARLRALPSTIGNLRNLRQLDLYNNPLTELPASFGNLDSLRIINLEFSGISVWPEAFRPLVKLSRVFFSGSNLTQLPDWIGEMQGLVELHLYNNPINHIPDSIGNLAATLRKLNVVGNTIPPARRAAIQALLPNTQISW